ncbi:phosphotransferase family protein [Rhodococcus sp. NPDC003382]
MSDTTTDSPLAGDEITALDDWMSARGFGHGPVTDLEQLTGGTQNLMVRFTRGDRSFVVRRGPRHLRPRTNDVLRREMRILDALSGTDVPHPRLIAACPEEDVWPGAAFYLVEPVDGFNAFVALPEPHASDPEIRHRMGLSMIDALATLASVDHTAIGLGDFGHPEGFVERQVPRWLRELESYTALDGYPGEPLPGVDAIADWLARSVPQRWTPGILHGDYHIGNVMFSPSSPEVAAILDWEMCTIGDPLLDLGWLLATWPEHGNDESTIGGALGDAGGLATRDELVERYAAQSDRDLSALDWYVVLACFKLGIILEGTYARAFAGKADPEVGQRLHATTLSLFRRALERIGQG